jgi:hypothetical protein
VKQLKALFNTFNLSSIINFPTRICASTSTAIDNIFIDISKYDYHTVSSLHNGLSDHEAQLLTIVSPLKRKNEFQTYSYRKIDNCTAAEFMLRLSDESWDEIFGGKDVNLIFNSFLNTYLRIFNASFPIIKKSVTSKSNITWITQGIRISCKRKRELYLMTKRNCNIDIKTYYDKYCKILNRVITAAKKMAYDNYCNKAYNKMKSTWEIINIETGRIAKRDETKYLIGKSRDIAETINDYFLSLADNLANSVENSLDGSSDRDFFVIYGTRNKI